MSLSQKKRKGGRKERENAIYPVDWRWRGKNAERQRKSARRKEEEESLRCGRGVFAGGERGKGEGGEIYSPSWASESRPPHGEGGGRGDILNLLFSWVGGRRGEETPREWPKGPPRKRTSLRRGGRRVIILFCRRKEKGGLPEVWDFLPGLRERSHACFFIPMRKGGREMGGKGVTLI